MILSAIILSLLSLLVATEPELTHSSVPPPPEKPPRPLRKPPPEKDNRHPSRRIAA